MKDLVLFCFLAVLVALFAFGRYRRARKWYRNNLEYKPTSLQIALLRAKKGVR